jgi:hypothetical protein
MIKLSTTSKLDGIKSWSLEAGVTCPGSIGADACKGCYAMGGNYRYPNVKAPRQANRIDWERPEWVQDMVQALQNERYFRWFDSGDMYHARLADKILEVMKQTPWVSHWLPTRMGKFPKFARVMALMQALPNVSVRFSSDSIHGEYVPKLHGSTIIPSANAIPRGVTPCQAWANDGKCNGCRACWDKTVPVIGYVAHGRTMIKLVNA